MSQSPQIIQIHDYNVSFYGGKLKQKFNIVIGLLNKDYGMIGWVKFYDKKEDVPSDGFDENKMMNMNLPTSLFEGVISSLRSGRVIKLLFVEETKSAMLVELPPEMPPEMFSNSNLGGKIN